ncbi:MAG: hypothetical protein IT204_18320 [Fimbriimonadaceae bacterium]|nr:hypothetical protein [Fimbriimonadaceae bacterium]
MWWVLGVVLASLGTWRAWPGLRQRRAARLAARQQHGRAVARWEPWEALLEDVRAAYRPGALAEEAAALRRRLPATADPAAAYAGWQRVLALEGPQSDAWTGLARAAILGGRPQAALAAAAEAVRAGHASWELLPALAESALAAAGGADLQLARLVQDVASASAAQCGSLYRRLRGLNLGVVLPAVLWQRLFQQVSDPEEELRQAESWGPPDTLDPWPAAWLEAAWRPETDLPPRPMMPDHPLVQACRADQQASRTELPTALAALAALRREGLSTTWSAVAGTLPGSPAVWLGAVGESFSAAGRRVRRDPQALDVAPLLAADLVPALAAGGALHWQADWTARWQAAVRAWLASGPAAR